MNTQRKKKIIRKATRVTKKHSQSTPSSMYARVPYNIRYTAKVSVYIASCFKETADLIFEHDGKEIGKRKICGKKVSVSLPKRTEWRNVCIPSIQGYASELGVSRKTLENWAEEHEEFEDALDRITDAQHNMLVQYGLSGYFNTKIVALLLSKHGYGTQAKEEDAQSTAVQIFTTAHERIQKEKEEEERRKREEG